MPSSMRTGPRIPSYCTCPRHFRQSIWYWSGQGACRWVRPPRHRDFLVRRIRVPAVWRLITQQPRRDGIQSWVNPSKSQVPVPSSVSWRAPGFLHALRAVLVGGIRRPQRAHRLGSTAMILRASVATAQPRTPSRGKAWLSDGREGLAVAAGFPLAVPHSPSPSRFTIPFPSHRTCRVPAYGGPTVFIPRQAQALSHP
jgi:hypothetical protein